MLVGKVVTASPCEGVARPEEYLVVAEGEGTLWLIPTEGRIYADMRAVPISGKNRWDIISVKADISKYISVVAKLETFLNLCKREMIDCTGRKCQSAEINLNAARRVLTQLLTDKVMGSLKAVRGGPNFQSFLPDFNRAYGKMQNDFFSVAYGGKPIGTCSSLPTCKVKDESSPMKSNAKTDKPSYVGKILFVEHGDTHGECICILESADYLYVFPISSTLDGCNMDRLPRTVKILSVREDRFFVEQYAERLSNFAESYDDHLIEGYTGAIFDFAVYDAARTAANQLRHFLKIVQSYKAKDETAKCCGK